MGQSNRTLNPSAGFVAHVWLCVAWPMDGFHLEAEPEAKPACADVLFTCSCDFFTYS